MVAPLIVAKDIVMDFYTDGIRSRILHGVNVELAANHITMIVGPSGSGKTTLISILTGMLTPFSGEVLFDNTNILALSNNQKCLFRQKEIGFVFQQHNLLPTLSAAENAAISLLAAKIPMKIAKIKSNKSLRDARTRSAY